MSECKINMKKNECVGMKKSLQMPNINEVYVLLRVWIGPYETESFVISYSIRLSENESAMKILSVKL